MFLDLVYAEMLLNELLRVQAPIDSVNLGAIQGQVASGGTAITNQFALPFDAEANNAVLNSNASSQVSIAGAAETPDRFDIFDGVTSQNRIAYGTPDLLQEIAPGQFFDIAANSVGLGFAPNVDLSLYLPSNVCWNNIWLNMWMEYYLSLSDNWNAPQAHWLALFEDDLSAGPEVAPTTEWSSGNYARQAIVFSDAAQVGATEVVESVQNGTVQFTDVLAPDDNIKSWGIYTAQTGGILVCMSDVNPDDIAGAGDDVIFPDGTIKIKVNG